MGSFANLIVRIVEREVSMKKLKCCFMVVGILAVAVGALLLWCHRDLLCRKIQAYFTAKDFTELPMED